MSGSTSKNVWNTFTTQTGTRSLVAGQRYYLEAMQKEGVGGDHVSAAWVIPGDPATNIIAAAYLEPADLSIAPTIGNQSFRVFTNAPNGTVFGTVTATDSPLHTLSFKLVGGNPNHTFALNPATGDLSVADSTALADGTFTSAVLTVTVLDSGLGGRYPLRSAQAAVTISLASTNDPVVWLGHGLDNNWATAGNWSGLAPQEGARLLFGKPLRQANVNNLAAFTARSLQLTNGGFTLSGSPLTLQAGLTNAGTNTLTLPITLDAAQTWLNFSGTLTLSGPVTNAGFNLNLIANADLQLDGPLSGSGGLIKSGTSRLLLQGIHTYTGPTTVSAASGTTTALELTGANDLDLSGSSLVMNGRMDLWNHNPTVGSLNGNGLIFANSGNRVLTVGGNQASGAFTGTLTNSTWASGATLALVKAGTGSQTLSGANSHSGGTTLRAGRISFSNGSALGTGLVTLGDANTGTNNLVLLATAAVTTTNHLLISSNATGTVTMGTESFAAGSVNMQYGGTLTLQRDVTLQAGSDDRTTFTNRLTGLGDVTITSPMVAGRRLVLSRPSGVASDFAGDVLINTNAWLQLGATNSLGNRVLPDASVVRFAPASRLRLAPTGSGDGETIGALDSLMPGAGIVELFTGTSFTLTLGDSNASGWFGGTIANSVGTLTVTKAGAGTQSLAGGNSFSGPSLVTGGTLLAAHANALGSAAQGTFVGTGATLAISNNITLTSEPLTLNGSGFAGTGALRNDAGTNACNGFLTFGSPTTVSALSGALSLGGGFNAAGNTPTFDSAADTQITVVNAFGGNGGLAKLGAGTLTLNSVCNFTGDTVVNAGTLALGAGGQLPSSTSITLAEGATLDATAPVGGFSLSPTQLLQGNGTLAGPAVLLGLVRPGNSIGRLSFTSDTSLAGVTVMEVSKTGAARTNDVLACGGTLTLGGTLTVLNAGPDPLTIGDSFQLFTASTFGAGAFATVELPVLSVNLGWDTSTLSTDGIVRVITAEPALPPSLIFQQAGGSLTLSWPLDYSSYTLQGQTNAPPNGLTGGWFLVPGVSNNTFALPLDPTAGSMFFRLVKP